MHILHQTLPKVILCHIVQWSHCQATNIAPRMNNKPTARARRYVSSRYLLMRRPDGDGDCAFLPETLFFARGDGERGRPAVSVLLCFLGCALSFLPETFFFACGDGERARPAVSVLLCFLGCALFSFLPLLSFGGSACSFFTVGMACQGMPLTAYSVRVLRTAWPRSLRGQLAGASRSPCCQCSDESIRIDEQGELDLSSNAVDRYASAVRFSASLPRAALLFPLLLCPNQAASATRPGDAAGTALPPLYSGRSRGA
jgi:hypothetical protein